MRDLDGFDRVWLLYWFGRARAAQLEVAPYLDPQTHEIFAARTSSRPNAIGIFWVRHLVSRIIHNFG